MAQLRNWSGAAQRVALLFVLLTLLVAPAPPLEAKMRVERLWLVTSAGKEFPIDVEIAEGREDKKLGLMFRTELADGKGMLFPYAEPSELTMWMRNTYIPLDMVFIRADGVVHRIEARTEPLSDDIIASHGPVLAVLELPGGAAERMGLKAGDHVRHRIFKAEAP